MKVNNCSQELGFDDQTKRYTIKNLTNILLKRFAPYVDVDVNNLELEYLEFLNCATINHGLEVYISYLLTPPYLLDEFESIKFYESPIGQDLVTSWQENGLQKLELTPIGRTIGYHASEIIIKKPIALT